MTKRKTPPGLWFKPDSDNIYLVFHKDPFTKQYPKGIPRRMNSGIPQKGTTDDDTAKNEYLALRKREAILHAIEKGEYEKPQPLPRIRLLDATKRYRTVTLVKHKNKGARGKELSAINLLLAEWGDKYVDEIVHKDRIDEYQAKRLGGLPLACDTKGKYRRAVSGATIDRELDVLWDICKNTLVPTYFARNPLIDQDGHKIYKDIGGDKNKKIRWVKPHEFQALVKAVLSRPFICGTPRLEGLVYLILAYESGLRLGSMVAIKWDHYDPTERVFEILTAKQEVDCAIPASDYLAPLLNTLGSTRTKEYIFQSHHRSKALDSAENHVQRWFEKLCSLANLPHGRDNFGLTVHCIRHGYGTQSQRNGGTVKGVSAGRWKDERIVMKYSHTDMEELRKIANSMVVGLAPIDPAVLEHYAPTVIDMRERRRR